MKRVPMLAMAGIVAATSPALGNEVMRCATHVIDQGTPREEVARHCGQPVVRNGDDRYWYYPGGGSMTVTRIFFVDDRVEFIDEVSKDEL